MNNDKKKKKLQILDISRDGKGISKRQVAKPGSLKKFFISYKDNFNKIIFVNIFFVLGNFPLIFLIATLSGYTKLESQLPMYDIFQNLNPFFSGEQSGYSLTLYALAGLQSQVFVPTTLTYVFYGISALTFLSFGVVNVGTAYILRNIAKGDPVFTWSDFIYAIKRNWKQALPFGIIDILINAILIFNIYNMVANSSDFLGSLMFWSNLVILIAYFFMRFYIYVQMVTFELTLFKIIKNSLIFVLVGLKRNVVAFVGIIAVFFIEIMLLFGTGGLLMPFAVAIPLAVMFSSCAYMKVYASYFKIKEIMIDPYQDESEPEIDEDEIIMRDDVTERERLEEIKARNNLQ